ncbi:MAG TPA: nitronate monooxygenase [Acidimicrobiales bacterium]|nr:nitronate monooxygenase [Acidimicrobiales bacterium]
MAGYRTRFTDLVGCRWPVQLAAMGGGVGGPELARAVQQAGGLGMVSRGEPVPDPGCGVNFLVPFLAADSDSASASDVAEAGRGAGVVEFFYGPPRPALVEAGRAAAPVVGWQVGSADEGRAAAEAGCDYVVVQGIEAGGHVRGRESLDAVLGQVLDDIDLPVVAAGGIATAERVADLIARGADAVRVGTRFLVCPEARAHDDYVAALLAASADDTVLTGWFAEGWPDAPHRVLRASVAAGEQSGWRSALPPARRSARPATDMAQYAGMGVGAVAKVEPAAEVVADLVRLL